MVSAVARALARAAGSLRGAGDQDVGGLVEVGRAEALAVLLVEAPAGGLVRLRRDDLALDQGAHRRLFVGLAAAFRIASGSASMPSRVASCSSSSRTTSARAAACQAWIGFCAGWFCVSRAMTSRGITAPLTLTVFGLRQRIRDRAIHDLLRRLKWARSDAPARLRTT